MATDTGAGAQSQSSEVLDLAADKARRYVRDVGCNEDVVFVRPDVSRTYLRALLQQDPRTSLLCDCAPLWCQSPFEYSFPLRLRLSCTQDTSGRYRPSFWPISDTLFSFRWNERAELSAYSVALPRRKRSCRRG